MSIVHIIIIRIVINHILKFIELLVLYKHWIVEVIIVEVLLLLLLEMMMLLLLSDISFIWQLMVEIVRGRRNVRVTVVSVPSRVEFNILTCEIGDLSLRTVKILII